MDEKVKHSNPNPVRKANALSRLFFCWMNPLFKIGAQRPLDVNDLYDVLPQDSSHHMCERLSKEWDKELLKKKSGGNPSLRSAIIRTFGVEYALWGIVAFFEEATKVLQPLMLGALIRYFTPGSNVSTRDAYLYAGGLSFCAMILALCHHPYFYGVQRIGMWLRVACCSLIYRKSLTLNNNAFGKTTTGQIVNLMSNDVVRFDQAPLFLHYLWIGPLQALTVLVLLWYKIGPASLAGFAVLLVLIPIQGSMGRLFSKLRRKTATQTDERVRLMNEILAGIRVIKMYCWENMFAKLVAKVRACEVLRIRICTLARAGLSILYHLGTKLLVYFLILTLCLTNPVSPVIRPEIIFPAMALLHVLRGSFFSRVSMAIQFSGESQTSIARIEEFLLLEEIEKPAIKEDSSPPKLADCRVEARNATATWDLTSSATTLNDITLDVKPGKLLAVIGPVGAGKSSLLMSLLGELPLTSGSVKVTGKVAYVAQQPWVFSASVRQNVTFGLPFDAKKYQQAIKASALTRDLEILPDGDATLVGERGVSMSGGQKARISLARALYFDADVYLLDDPLSAVDTAVGRHLFENCICGLLKNKPRILVTHQLQYLKQADEILILKEGSVMGRGTFDSLASSGIDFAALLRRKKKSKGSGSEDESEDEDEEDEENFENAHPPFHIKSDDFLLEKSSSHIKISNPLYLGKRRMSRSLHSLYAPLASDKRLLSKSAYGLHSPSLLRRRNLISAAESIESLGQRPSESMISIASLNPDIQGEFVAQPPEEERREVGTVTCGVYARYFWVGGGVLGSILLLLLNILAQSSYILSDWWLSYWATQEEVYVTKMQEHEYLVAQGFNETNITVVAVDTHQYLAIYSGFVVSVFVFGLVRALLTFYLLVRAAAHLHDDMFAAIIRCPMLFFDTNISGRILNRFSKDMGLIDETLPVTMYDFLLCFLLILGIILVAGVINPWVFIPTVPLAILFLLVRRYFLRTSRDIKRLEATTRSPVYSHMSATLQGLHTVRALKAEDAFMEEFHRHQDLHTSSWFMFLSSNRWFAIRLDWLCALFITAVAFCSVFSSEGLNSGLVGLTLSYALALMGLFQWGVRQSAEVENQMTSVERIFEYSRLTPEAPLESEPDKKPDSDWPKNGIITASDLSLKYSADAPVVLKKINFSISSKEKVGIVGRTGAGKSSLITLLFRMAEPEGDLRIDGVDISQLGLHDLRSKISIIPQDPVLFTGPVRRNLDPFEQHSDEALWLALEEVQLKSVIEALQGQLDADVSEGGLNFSVGQRQLLCLARAILRRNRILVIDEATANVDHRTDGLIQETIRAKFKHCTVLTIAHRLNTIMDSDRVLVLNEGKILEFDHPHNLLQNNDGSFTGMVKQTGPAEEEHLREIAEAAYHSRGSQTEEDSRLSDANMTEDYHSGEDLNHKKVNGHVYLDGDAVGSGETETTRLTDDGCDARVLPNGRDEGKQGRHDDRV